MEPSSRPSGSSFNGRRGSTNSNTQTVYSKQEAGIYETLWQDDNDFYEDIDQPVGSGTEKYYSSPLEVEQKPTFIVFEGPAPCEIPVTLKADDDKQSPKSVCKLRSLIHNLKEKHHRSIQFSADPYVASKDVAALQMKNFSKFIKHLDVAFVLFYNPFDDNCRWAKINMREAASCTQKERSAYGAVDCTKECELCKSQDIKSFPTMKLFSQGHLVNTFGDETVLQSTDIQTFVEKVPIVEKRKKRSGCVLQ